MPDRRSNTSKCHLLLEVITCIKPGGMQTLHNNIIGWRLYCIYLVLWEMVLLIMLLYTSSVCVILYICKEIWWLVTNGIYVHDLSFACVLNMYLCWNSIKYNRAFENSAALDNLWYVGKSNIVCLLMFASFSAYKARLYRSHKMNACHIYLVNI